jgi:hypothetical protein
MNNNIPVPLNPQQADVPATGFDYNSWREKFLLTLLRISCVLGFGITLFSFIQSAQPRDWIIFPILLVTLAAVTFLRASYNLRAYILLFVTFAI